MSYICEEDIGVVSFERMGDWKTNFLNRNCLKTSQSLDQCNLMISAPIGDS